LQTLPSMMAAKLARHDAQIAEGSSDGLDFIRFDDHEPGDDLEELPRRSEQRIKGRSTSN
jgi:hypothetical protein